MMFLKVANVSSAAWALALNSERFYQQPLRAGAARPGLANYSPGSGD